MKLLEAARAARTNAYAPYSNFKVGAAVLDPDGYVTLGCNVENASYGLTICAERNALGAHIAAGRRLPLAVAIAGGEEPCPPCGACRQVLMEFNPDMVVILDAGAGEFKCYKLSDMLPLSFSKTFAAGS